MIVVKHKYIPGRGPKSGGKVVAIGKAVAHVNYIQHRPGPDREQGGRELFNETDNVDAKKMRQEIKRLGGSRVVIHKLTLAPEINVEDKKEFTRQVMDDLSRDKGLDLVWFGAEHNNTDHHHIHVVVLGKDRNGTEVRLDLRDIDKAKEYGDRYLEKWHPRELERSRREREDKEKERRQERDKARETAREERQREGLELPWMNKKITREQIEPYKQWSKNKREREKETERTAEEEKPYHQDTIEAAGKQWSKTNTLRELQDLNDYLWDNVDERIPNKDYRKLKNWIKQKEKLRDELNEREPAQEKEKEPLKQEPTDQKPTQEKNKEPHRDEPESRRQTEGHEKESPKKEDKQRDQIEYQGEKFKSNDSYDKLTGLLKKTREDERRLPFDDYQKLRVWIEDADRARFSGAVEKELERVHKRDRTRTMEDLKAMEGGRVLEPAQEEMMRNPIVGVFLKVASVSKEIVRSIPLDDRLRDPLKEGRDELEAGKKGIDEREAERNKIPTSNMTPEELRGLRQGEKKDRDNRERIEQDIEGNKKAKARELKKQKEDREKADKERREPYDTFDPWGMY